MTQRMPHPVLQKLSALILLGVALGLGVSAIVYPIIEASSERDAAYDRLAKYEETLAQPFQQAPYDPDELTAEHIDDADAQLALQSVIDRLARSASVNLLSIQPMAAEHLGEMGRGAWTELSLTCDLQALVEFLASFDAQRPLLLVRRLEVRRTEGPRPDLFLNVKIDVGRAWRLKGRPT